MNKKLVLILICVLFILGISSLTACKFVKTRPSSADTDSTSTSVAEQSDSTQQSDGTSASDSQEVEEYVITINGGTGSGTYAYGAEVTATATIPEGKNFVKWMNGENEVSTDDPYVFTASEDITLTAVFADITYTITVENGEGSGTYAYGAEVTATAIIPEGKNFVKWMNGENEVSTDDPYVFTASEDITLTAVFENDSRYFATGENYIYVNEEEINYNQLTFNYKITSEEGTYFQLAILDSAWSSGYGYIKFDSTGAIGNGSGVTCVASGDGYMSVTINLASAKLFSASTPEKVSLILIRGDWSNACGYIENILFAKVPNVKAGVDYTKALPSAVSCNQVSFDYKIVNGSYFNMGLFTDWSNFYSYFQFSASGLTADGVTCAEGEDGYIHAVINLDLVNSAKKTGNPGDISFIYIRGNWSNADAIVENFAFDTIVAAEEFVAGTGMTKAVAQKAYTTITFEYKITSETGYFNLALLDDWSHGFGYYVFDANGAQTTYNGVSCTVLDDGFISVTITVANLTKIFGTEPEGDKLQIFFMRGDWSTASGLIRKLSFNE